MAAFFEKVGSSVYKILAYGSHSLTNFQSILDWFIPNLMLKYENSENIKADRLNTVVFNLR